MPGEDLKALADSAAREIAAAADDAALEAARVRYLGRKEGALSEATKRISSLPAEARPAYGAAVNEAKRRIEAALDQRGAALRERAIARDLAGEKEDLTLPPRRVRVGRLHPISQTIREVSHIFATLGFETVEGPEIEWDYYNFEALNIPPGHPAREKWQTLWISNPLGDDPSRPMLGRTHTSPMQIRVMEKRRPPIRVVIPGRCYRYEATDAIRESIFFQYEGLAIDEKLTMADLKGVLYSFARQVFGGDRKVRFRPDYFPFTEPSAEIAFDCFACEGKDPRCRTCGGSGWIEAAGCGMVHPDVLRRVGYDPERYQGFAFGGGIERLAMLRTGAPDIRLFYQNDLRYLEQF
ncbi:MAG TPA: phenylalanine--tRNA ligase subunit alpha [Candidatus Limnocylindria bacterium]|jgi:phenylalanyl-tRNA synthetase alpha chain|nr:phenylalanine--tRNA ligase subunit alpha [Candidatus Limnocylindria bacterium]